MTPGGAAELLEQPFAALGSGSGVVGAELKKRGLELLEFVRLEVGEGVQVAQEDYQAAVNAAMRA
jgi:translation elongation factor EF-Ts